MTMFQHTIASIKSMKGKSPQEKWRFFLDYYAIATAIILVVLISIVSWVVSVANKKDVVLSGTLVSCNTVVENTDYSQLFYEYAGINTEEEQLKFSLGIDLTDDSPRTYSANLQALFTQVGMGDIDFITGQAEIFSLFAYNRSHLLVDLRKVLPEEMLSQLEGRLYYIDNDILQQPVDYSGLTAAYEDRGTFDPEYPDPTKPEEMVDPIPIGINIRDCQQFWESYYPESETLFLGVANQTPHPEMLLTFLQFLLFDNG